MDKEVQLSKPYSYGAYNKCSETEQWIRLTEGCPNQCPYCAEPLEFKIFPIPKIVRNKVKILDMNLLSKPESLAIIKELGQKKVNNKVVYYELTCGIDYRFLTLEIAKALYDNRFVNIRLAWDSYLNRQCAIKDSIEMLVKVGYDPHDIMVFMICNWLIPFSENLKKLDLLKVWNVQVHDAYFDNQLSPNFKPIHWTIAQMREFRSKAREHNQIVNFRMFPEITSMNKSQTTLSKPTYEIRVNK